MAGATTAAVTEKVWGLIFSSTFEGGGGGNNREGGLI